MRAMLKALARSSARVCFSCHRFSPATLPATLPTSRLQRHLPSNRRRRHHRAIHRATRALCSRVRSRRGLDLPRLLPRCTRRRHRQQWQRSRRMRRQSPRQLSRRCSMQATHLSLPPHHHPQQPQWSTTDPMIRSIMPSLLTSFHLLGTSHGWSREGWQSQSRRLDKGLILRYP